MQFIHLLRQAPRQLAFGALHSFGSSFGQTFLVALFVPFISASLALNETEFANIYAGITIGSALCLPIVGRWIDKVDILSYSLATMVLLAVGCLLISFATNVWMLIGALFILRLAGQGLMTHVSMTGIARYFSRNRGRALAIASFGFPLAEAILPATLLALIAAFGWRYTYAGSGVFILLILIPLAFLLIRGDSKFRNAPTKSGESAKTSNANQTGTAQDSTGNTDQTVQTDTSQPETNHPRLFKSFYVWLCLPMLAAPPLIMTALFFHQGAISNHKNIDLGWFAAGFTVFAITSVLGAFGSGPLIDKHSARRLFPWHLIPMMAGIAVLAVSSQPYVILIYMGLVGITVGFATTLRTAIIPELVPLDEIGAVRSTLTAVMVLASAMGPAIYGWMFAADIHIEMMLIITLIVMAVITVMSWASERPGFYVPPGVSPQDAQ